MSMCKFEVSVTNGAVVADIDKKTNETVISKI